MAVTVKNKKKRRADCFLMPFRTKLQQWPLRGVLLCFSVSANWGNVNVSEIWVEKRMPRAREMAPWVKLLTEMAVWSPEHTEKDVMPASLQDMGGRGRRIPRKLTRTQTQKEERPASEKIKRASIDSLVLSSDLHVCHGIHITYPCARSHAQRLIIKRKNN